MQGCIQELSVVRKLPFSCPSSLCVSSALISGSAQCECAEETTPLTAPSSPIQLGHTFIPKPALVAGG